MVIQLFFFVLFYSTKLGDCEELLGCRSYLPNNEIIYSYLNIILFNSNIYQYKQNS